MFAWLMCENYLPFKRCIFMTSTVLKSFHICLYTHTIKVAKKYRYNFKLF